jgi:hypothetical protein
MRISRTGWRTRSSCGLSESALEETGVRKSSTAYGAACAPVGRRRATRDQTGRRCDDVITRLSSNSIDQEAGRRFVRVHSESQRTFRRALYVDHMQPISRVAREVFGASGMNQAFRMPPTSVADQTLLAAAGAMAEAAASTW